ncbi:uncharacterized protein LOC126828846 [Patella vulgata]|uniref:uncharacterized protein LOC126828846 n=1 Tax=Patella vulgata TaxID=6465 RepID=UPI00218082E6|nr:uncharacterized protein LOC126828846 [Patella vulgata]
MKNTEWIPVTRFLEQGSYVLEATKTDDDLLKSTLIYHRQTAGKINNPRKSTDIQNLSEISKTEEAHQSRPISEHPMHGREINLSSDAPEIPKVDIPDDLKNKSPPRQMGALATSDFVVRVKIKQTRVRPSCHGFRTFPASCFMLIRFDKRCPSDLIHQLLNKGLIIKENGQENHFAFFGYTRNQIYSSEKECYLYNQSQLGSHDDVIQTFGDLGQIESISKRSLRIGLLFSNVVCQIEIQENQIKIVDDVERNNFIFTEGCGCVSESLALRLFHSLGKNQQIYKHQKPECPSVFQIRLKGFKGTVVVDKSLAPDMLNIRKSMVKFEFNPKAILLGFVSHGISWPYNYGHLNQQYINILSDLGIQRHVFLEKQEQYYAEIQRDFNLEPYLALKYLAMMKRPELIEDFVVNGKLSDQAISVLTKLRKRAFMLEKSSGTEEGINYKYSKAGKLNFPIENSRNVFGVCDISGTLKPGTCFFQPTVLGTAKIITGRVIVVKSPCYHSGDLRKLNCVDNQKLRHLVDCVVFPTQGERPVSDEIAGSDLDGDKYFICWDKDLIPERTQQPISNVTPHSSKSTPKQLESPKPVGQTDMIKFFSEFDNSKIGKFDKDFNDLEFDSPEARLMASTHGEMIDSAKTGSTSSSVHSKTNQVGNQSNSVIDQLMENAKRNIEMFYSNEHEITKSDTQNDHHSLLTEKEMDRFLSNPNLAMSDFDLYRIIYKWCIYRERQEDLQTWCERFVDFTRFTEHQRWLAEVDCPGDILDRNIIYNGLSKSEVLSPAHRAKIQNFHRVSWCKMAEMRQDDFNWKFLVDELTSDRLILIAFPIQRGDGGVWKVSMLFPGYLRKHTSTHSPMSAFISLRDGGDEKDICSDYEVILHPDRLQMYPRGTNKQSTFINLMMLDTNETVVSIALQRFSRPLFEKHRDSKIQKDVIGKCELFCGVMDIRDGPVLYVRDIGRSERAINKSDATESFNESHKASLNKRTGITNTNEKPGHRSNATKLAPGDPGASFSTQHAQEKGFDYVERLCKDIDKEMDKSGETEKAVKHTSSKIGQLISLMGESELQLSQHIAKRLQHYLWKYQNLRLRPDDFYKVFIILVSSTTRTKGGMYRKVSRYLEEIDSKGIYLSLQNYLDFLDYVIYLENCNPDVINLLKEIEIGLFPIATNEFYSLHAKLYFLKWTSRLTVEAVRDANRCEMMACMRISNKHILTAEASYAGVGLLNLNTAHKKDTSPEFLVGSGVVLTQVPKPCQTIYNRFYGEVVQCSPKCLTVRVDKTTDARKNVETVELTELSGQILQIEDFPNLSWYRKQVEALKIVCCHDSVYQNIKTSGFPPLASPRLPDLCPIAPGIFPIKPDSGDDGLDAQDATSCHVSGINSILHNQQIGPVPSQGRHDVSFKSNGRHVKDVHKEIDQKNLDDSQRATVADALTRQVSIINGAPGTGKTRTLVEIVYLLMHQDPKERVLVCFKANSGIRHCSRLLCTRGVGESDMVWVSRDVVGTAEEDKLLLQNRCRSKSPKNIDIKTTHKDFLGQSKLVLCKYEDVGMDILYEEKFDHVLLDDINLVNELSVLLPVLHGCSSVCFVGDVSGIGDKQGITSTIFNRFQEEGRCFKNLTFQHRIPLEIWEFVGKTFYPGVSCLSHDRTRPRGFPVCRVNNQNRLIFINVQGREDCLTNEKEVEKILDVCRSLINSGDISPVDVGVSSIYQQQIDLVHDKLVKDLKKCGQANKGMRLLDVKCLDEFHGCEKDVMIFSCVKTKGELGPDFNENMLKHLLASSTRGVVIIGCYDTMNTSDLWSNFLTWMEQKHMVLNKSVSEQSSRSKRTQSSGKYHSRSGQARGIDKDEQLYSRSSHSRNGFQQPKGAAQQRDAWKGQGGFRPTTEGTFPSSQSHQSKGHPITSTGSSSKDGTSSRTGSSSKHIDQSPWCNVGRNGQSRSQRKEESSDDSWTVVAKSKSKKR